LSDSFLGIFCLLDRQIRKTPTPPTLTANHFDSEAKHLVPQRAPTPPTTPKTKNAPSNLRITRGHYSAGETFTRSAA
jgi:hypothetical protein